MKTIRIICTLFALWFINVQVAQAADEFVIQKIQVTGNQRVSDSTVINYLPIQVGETFKPADSAKIIQALYQTGFFSDVSLSRQNNTLLIKVDERPTLGVVSITGNKSIPEKEFDDMLLQTNVIEGRVYSPANVTHLQNAIEQYFSQQGRFNTSVVAEAKNASRNRVDLQIQIKEGQEAKIRSIKIIGAYQYSQRTLLKQFKLTTPGLLTLITKNDRYSKEKLNFDLENLRTFYLDRGYLRFEINSTQVSMSPDKANVYIVIHITEGAQYRIAGFDVSGEVNDEREKLLSLITLKKNETFSRKEVLDNSTRIMRYLGDQGYAFADVVPVPEIVDKSNFVKINYRVTRGKRMYVRRINFTGNNKTIDEVMRRELKQQEGSLYSYEKINESQRRLATLGYFEDVQVKTTQVPESSNQVDLDYEVKETSTAKLTFDVGYSLTYGLLYGANVSQNNFLGTGKQVALSFNRTGYNQAFRFSYNNPYYTQDGISRGFSIYAQEYEPDSEGLTKYTVDQYGASLTFGFPIASYDRISLSTGYEHVQLGLQDNAPIQLQDFVDTYGHIYDLVKLSTAWTHSNLNKLPYPTKGFKSQFVVAGTVPSFGDTLTYYKVSYDFSWFLPMNEDWIFLTRGSFGYGDGYGDTKVLPFFNNYYAGGIGSVRGFAGNSLGTLDSEDATLGGNILTVGSLALIFPNPFSEKIRTSLFVDSGFAFENNYDFDQLRYSTGLQVEWWSPFGPLQFVLASPLNAHESDDVRVFDFSVGTSF